MAVIEIREECEEDFQEVRQVIVVAGGKNPGDEDAAADLVELLRERNKALISLVAVSSNKVVGHIMFSPVTVAVAPKDLFAVALAPLMVRPEYQRQGIGSMLAREGLNECTKAGYDMVVVLGHSEYYPRFGFTQASDYGLGRDSRISADPNYMVLGLKNGVLDEVSGVVQFAPEFKETGC